MPVILQNHEFDSSNFNSNVNSYIQFIIENDNLENSILVLPTNKWVRKVQKEIINLYFEKYNKPCTPPRVYNFKDFAILLYRVLFFRENFILVSDAYRLVLMEEAIQKSKLNFFRNNNRRINPTILNKINDVLYGIKEDGLLPIDLLKNTENNLSNNKANSKLKLNDLFNIYSEYQNLFKNNLLDFPELLSKLDSKFKNTENSDFIRNFSKYFQVPVDNNFIIGLFGFTEFKMPEINLLGHFSKIDIKLLINLDFSEQNGPLFGNLQESRDKLINNKFIKKIVDEFDNKLDILTLKKSHYIRRFLFEPDLIPFEIKLKENLKIIECENIDIEIKVIAKYIKNLLNINNYSINDFCICIRNPELYSNKFREIFSNYSIPVNITDRYKLSTSPLVISIFNILDVVINDFLIDDLIKVFKNPYLNLNYYKDNELITFNGSNLINLSKILRISGGKSLGGFKYWINRFENTIISQEKMIEYLKQDNSVDEIEIAQIRVKISNIEKGLVDFISLRNKISFNNSKLSPKEFNLLIREKIIKEFRIKESIIESLNFIKGSGKSVRLESKLNEIKEIEKDSRALKKFLMILDELTFILNDRYPNQLFTLSEIYDRLKTAIIGARYQVKEKSNSGVTITSIEQTRGIDFPVMILCNANDGDFPLSYQTDKFLDKNLDDSEIRHIRSEQIQFYQFLTNAKNLLDNNQKQILITYKSTENDNDLIRSSFLDSLISISDYKINDIQLIDSINSNVIENDSPLPDWMTKLSSMEENFINLSIRNLLGYKNDSREMGTIYYQNKFLIENANDNLSNLFNMNEISNESKNLINKKVDKSISISFLESYKKCPYKFYLDRIIKFESQQELSLNFTPIEMGNIIHYILYSFYKNIQQTQDGIITIHPSESGLPELKSVNLIKEKRNYYLDILKSIALEYLNQIKIDHPFYQIDEISILGNSNIKGYLENWLDNEIQNLLEFDNQLLPGLFEFSFGNSSYSTNNNTIPSIDLSNSLKLKGKIDRIEIVLHEDNYYIMIGDYKSSIRSKTNHVLKGISFQMPLYLKAAMELIKRYYNISPKPIGGIYYNFKALNFKDYSKYVIIDKNFQPLKKIRHNYKVENLNEIIDLSLNFANELLNDIKNMKFDVIPLTSYECSNCNFKEVCKIKQRNNNLHKIDKN